MRSSSLREFVEQRFQVGAQPLGAGDILDILKRHFAIADDGVERCSEIVAKLGLFVDERVIGVVLAGRRRITQAIDEDAQRARRDEHLPKRRHKIVEAELAALVDDNFLVAQDAADGVDQILPHDHEPGPALKIQT